MTIIVCSLRFELFLKLNLINTYVFQPHLIGLSLIAPRVNHDKRNVNYINMDLLIMYINKLQILNYNYYCFRIHEIYMHIHSPILYSLFSPVSLNFHYLQFGTPVKENVLLIHIFLFMTSVMLHHVSPYALTIGSEPMDLPLV